MQRLFSTFPGSWPGLGLLILRLTVAAMALLLGVEPGSAVGSVLVSGQPLWVTLPIALVTACLTLGLATPVASSLVLVALVVFGSDIMPSQRLVLAGVSLSLMMLGPGAWSLDSRIYGRKQIRFGDE